MCLEASEVMGWWTADPLAIGAVGISSAFYAAGVARLWRREGVGSGVRRWEAACFAIGQLTVLLALVSPVDRLSDILFSAHMTQHEVIMVVAPPLVVLGRPVVAFLWALPRAARARTTRALARVSRSMGWRAMGSAVGALVVHALVVWLWHVPSLFEAALRDDGVHAVQHATFFASAVLFWWAVVRGRHGRAGYGLACLFVFATAMHTSLLGALLTFGSSIWYPVHAARTVAVEVDPAADQRLAGLVMWVPAGTVLALVGLALFTVWLGESERRRRRQLRHV